MRIILFFVVSFLVSCVSLPNYSVTVGTPFESIFGSFLHISCGSELFFFYETSSAVIIEDGLAVSSIHSDNGYSFCGKRFTARTINGREFSAEIISYSRTMDIVFLKIPKGIGRPAVVSGGINVGDKIWAMGSPIGGSPTATGIIDNVDFYSLFQFFKMKGLPKINFCGMEGYNIKGFALREAGNITFGYSGGPVVNDKGELIGIIEGVFDSGSSIDDDCRPFVTGNRLVFVHKIVDIINEIEGLKKIGLLR